MEDREKAIALFTSIESWSVPQEWEDPETETLERWAEPVFDVRLDAASREDSAGNAVRDWRIRLTMSAARLETRSEWMIKAMNAAKDLGVDVRLENAGIELS